MIPSRSSSVTSVLRVGGMMPTPWRTTSLISFHTFPDGLPWLGFLTLLAAFADAGARIADEPHPARRQIGDTADEIENLAGSIGVERVHGKIAALRVQVPIMRERHDRVASVGRHVAAQGRDLERFALDDGGDGAMLDSGRNEVDASSR